MADVQADVRAAVRAAVAEHGAGGVRQGEIFAQFADRGPSRATLYRWISAALEEASWPRGDCPSVPPQGTETAEQPRGETETAPQQPASAPCSSPGAAVRAQLAEAIQKLVSAGVETQRNARAGAIADALTCDQPDVARRIAARIGATQ